MHRALVEPNVSSLDSHEHGGPGGRPGLYDLKSTRHAYTRSRLGAIVIILFGHAVYPSGSSPACTRRTFELVDCSTGSHARGFNLVGAAAMRTHTARTRLGSHARVVKAASIARPLAVGTGKTILDKDDGHFTNGLWLVSEWHRLLTSQIDVTASLI